jgi:hypothetical protein
MTLSNVYIGAEGNITVDFAVATSMTSSSQIVIQVPPDYGNINMPNIKCTLTPYVATGNVWPAAI